MITNEVNKAMGVLEIDETLKPDFNLFEINDIGARSDIFIRILNINVSNFKQTDIYVVVGDKHFCFTYDNKTKKRIDIRYVKINKNYMFLNLYPIVENDGEYKYVFIGGDNYMDLNHIATIDMIRQSLKNNSLT